MRVEIALGVLAGAREGGVGVFRGVPYARPPLGHLRFAPPAELEAWHGVRPATDFAPAPAQRPDALVQRLHLAGEGPFAEDCLYLNVWTPATPAADRGARPVLVWIPGGAFIGGAASSPIYDGHHLAARGDVVVVTVNYRVGALGFLQLEDAASNLGLLDQIAALRWVREHISRFGGDPGNVTVFGESAGAGSLCALLAMPASDGLMRRAIVQSAAPDGVLDPAEAARRAKLFLRHLGLEAPAAAPLREVPTESLLDAQDRTQKDGPFANGMLFAPVVDGVHLPQRPLDAVRAGAARHVDLVIGTTREELQLYALGAPENTIGAALLPRLVAGLVGEEAAGALIDRYRRARPTATATQLYYAIHTDFAMRIPSIELAQAQAECGGTSYMYQFTWPSPLQEGALGACHALDLPFTFGTLEAPGMKEFAGTGPVPERISQQVMDAWVAFARTGDPSHSGIGPWPTYDAERRATFLFGEHSHVHDAPEEIERASWN